MLVGRSASADDVYFAATQVLDDDSDMPDLEFFGDQPQMPTDDARPALAADDGDAPREARLRRTVRDRSGASRPSTRRRPQRPTPRRSTRTRSRRVRRDGGDAVRRAVFTTRPTTRSTVRRSRCLKRSATTPTRRRAATSIATADDRRCAKRSTHATRKPTELAKSGFEVASTTGRGRSRRTGETVLAVPACRSRRAGPHRRRSPDRLADAVGRAVQHLPDRSRRAAARADAGLRRMAPRARPLRVRGRDARRAFAGRLVGDRRAGAGARPRRRHRGRAAGAVARAGRPDARRRSSGCRTASNRCAGCCIASRPSGCRSPMRSASRG